MDPRPSQEVGLLQALYASLLDADAQTRVVSRLAAAFDSHLVALQRDGESHLHDPSAHYDAHGRLLQPPPTLPPDLINPWLAAAGARRLFVDGAAHEEGLLSPQRLKASAFYEYVLRPLDIFHSLGLFIAADADRFNVLTLSRARAAGHYSQADVARAQRLLPHLRNVHALQKQLDHAPIAALEGHRHALWLLDQRGRVAFQTAAADALVGVADGGLDLRSGRLVATQPRDDHHLATAVVMLTSATPQATTLLIHDRAGRLWAVLELRPVPHRLFQPWLVGQPTVAIVQARLLAPAPRLRLNTLLAELYGLSQSEARVATALLSVDTVADVAAHLHRSEQTIRSQLKAVYAKTGVNTQARLLRLLDRLAGH